MSQDERLHTIHYADGRAYLVREGQDVVVKFNHTISDAFTVMTREESLSWIEEKIEESERALGSLRTAQGMVETRLPK